MNGGTLDEKVISPYPVRLAGAVTKRWLGQVSHTVTV